MIYQSDNYEESLSIEQLEDEVAADPENVGAKAELAQALVDGLIDGSCSSEGFDRLESLLNEIPEDQALFARGYLAWLDSDETTAVSNLCDDALEVAKTWEEPFDVDALYWSWVFPFEDSPPKGLWRRLAEAFATSWPDSAAVFTLRGMAEEDPGAAVDSLVLALDKDDSYWLAAYACAQAFAEQKNWRAARGYYLRALMSETAASFAEYQFNLAWCYGETKEYDAEARTYRLCLDLDPDYPFARNNLGWSLMKAGKYEEAVEVLEDALQRGNDGKYPQRNLVRVFRKLGRFSEAIDLLRQDLHRGTLTKYAQKQIAEIEALAHKQEQGVLLIEKIIEDELEDENESSAVSKPLAESNSDGPESESMTIGSPPDTAPSGDTFRKKPIRTTRPVQTEQSLESLLEELIHRGGEAFGRRLRVYETADGLYGRQLAVPGVGRVDLLVEDLDTEDLIVVELKRDKTTDEVVGQLCRYLAWVRQNLALVDQKVKGIICVHQASEKLRLAVSAVDGAEVFEYTLDFRKL